MTPRSRAGRPASPRGGRGMVCVVSTTPARACADIALVKYWGKRPDPLNLPAAGSLSLALDALATTTQVTFDPDLADDELVLDGAPARPASSRGPASCSTWCGRRPGSPRARVVSQNEFPTASELACRRRASRRSRPPRRMPPAQRSLLGRCRHQSANSRLLQPDTSNPHASHSWNRSQPDRPEENHPDKRDLCLTRPPQHSRVARAGAGGSSAGAAPTPIRAAAPGEFACRRSPERYALQTRAATGEIGCGTIGSGSTDQAHRMTRSPTYHLSTDALSAALHRPGPAGHRAPAGRGRSPPREVHHRAAAAAPGALWCARCRPRPHVPAPTSRW
jgi:hypothetical protein